MAPVSSSEEAFEWVLLKLGAPRAKASPVSPQQKKEEIQGKKVREIELWKTWKNAPAAQKPQHLNPLLESFTPLIQARVNLFKNRTEIPTSAIEHEHKKEFIKALETYDPSKGAALGTHITNRLRKVDRYIESNKNFTRITENIYSKIGAFNGVKSELTEQLGHAPSDQHIHDHLVKNPHPTLGVLSMKDIGRLNREQRRGLIQTGHDTEDFGGTPHFSSRDDEVIHLVQYKLTEPEKAVYEYTFGLNGKPQMKPGDIAKTLRMDNSKVSKLRTSIFNKMSPYLEN